MAAITSHATLAPARSQENGSPEHDALRAIARGDATAVRDFYDAHASYVAGVLFRVLGADAELDDLVQETFLSALDVLHTVENAASVRGFLATIAVRKALRLVSKRRRRRTLFGVFALFGATRSDPRATAAAEDLLEALERLPTDLRMPWILARTYDFTLPEVAKACAISLATTKRRIAQAEERMRGRFEP
ncbi:MAG: RNA polymerase sigma factor [Polyangiaceae bacterium]